MSEEYKAVLTGGPLKGGLFKSKKKKKGKRKREQEQEAPPSEGYDVAEDHNSRVDDEVLDSDGAGRAEDANAEAAKNVVDDNLTEAQRRFREKRLERERKQIRSMVKETHRERVERFNALLASMTEHNDIPRCSAAGNG